MLKGKRIFVLDISNAKNGNSLLLVALTRAQKHSIIVYGLLVSNDLVIAQIY